VVFNFSGPGTEYGSLEDGNYSLQFNAAAIQAGGPGGRALAASAAVDPATYNARFHRLFGDANGNARVGEHDMLAFALALGSKKGTPDYRAYFDFNNDGVINKEDRAQFERGHPKAAKKLHRNGTVSERH
jgi:Dockerin type I domain